jgi:poly(A) polymerase
MKSLRDKALFVIGVLRNHGFQAYFCGGCVRDLLLGLAPKDYDIVTDAQPQEVQKLFKRTVPVGMQFGIIRVVLGQETFEVATFRQDGSYSDGRRPTSVRFCDAQTDAQRRDFTINGLFLDPETNQINDYVGGRDDIEHKVVRTIGEPQERFAEDYLRMLRAVRFACQLGFVMEEKTWQTIRHLAPHIQKISGERVRDELLKMLTGRDPAQAIVLLEQCGLLTQILPEVARLMTITCPRHGGSLFSCAIVVLRQGTPFRDYEQPLAVLFWHIGQLVSGRANEQETSRQMVSDICRRLKLPREANEKITSCVVWHPQLSLAFQWSKAALKKFLRQPFMQDLLTLYKLHVNAGDADHVAYQYCQQKLQELASVLHPAPLIGGAELIALGLQPGPMFKTILDFVEEQQLEDRISKPEEATVLVRQKFRLPSQVTHTATQAPFPCEGDKL